MDLYPRGNAPDRGCLPRIQEYVLMALRLKRLIPLTIFLIGSALIAIPLILIAVADPHSEIISFKLLREVPPPANPNDI